MIIVQFLRVRLWPGTTESYDRRLMMERCITIGHHPRLYNEGLKLIEVSLITSLEGFDGKSLPVDL
jgi:hypothetical protein